MLFRRSIINSFAINFLKVALPAGLSPATATFEASHSDNLSYGSVKLRVEGAEPAPSSLSTIKYQLSEMVGRHGFAPCSRRVRAGTSLSKFAAQSRREGGVEPQRPDSVSPGRHR